MQQSSKFRTKMWGSKAWKPEGLSPLQHHLGSGPSWGGRTHITQGNPTLLTSWAWRPPPRQGSAGPTVFAIKESAGRWAFLEVGWGIWHFRREKGALPKTQVGWDVSRKHRQQTPAWDVFSPLQGDGGVEVYAQWRSWPPFAMSLVQCWTSGLPEHVNCSPTTAVTRS